MVSHHRTLVHPSYVALCSKDRLRAIHDRAAVIGYASSIINTFVPQLTQDAVVRHHDVDVLVIGSNPILAAVAAHRIASQGHSVGVALQDRNDDWPYDLATSELGLSLIEGIVGLVGTITGRPDWRMAELIRTMVGQSQKQISVLPAGVTLSLALRQPTDELLIHVWRSGETQVDGPIQNRLLSDFRSAASGHRLLVIPPGLHRTAVFARFAVLVSMVDHFSRADVNVAGTKAIRWVNDRILSFGTSAWTPSSPSEAAERMVEDLVSLSKIELPQG